jgi:hypothetical protein
MNAVEPHPTPPQALKPEPPPRPANAAASPNLDRNPSSLANPFIYPETLNPVSVTGRIFDAVLDTARPLRLPIFTGKGPFARGR